MDEQLKKELYKETHNIIYDFLIDIININLRGKLRNRNIKIKKGFVTITILASEGIIRVNVLHNETIAIPELGMLVPACKSYNLKRIYLKDCKPNKAKSIVRDMFTDIKHA